MERERAKLISKLKRKEEPSAKVAKPTSMTKEDKLEYKVKAAKLSDFQKPDAGIMAIAYFVSFLHCFLFVFDKQALEIPYI